MIRLLVINIAFGQPHTYARWRLLAQQNPDVDITLVGPKHSKYEFMGEPLIFKTEEIKEDGFRVVNINMLQPRWFKYAGLKGWFSGKLFKIVKNIKPDLIYLIGHEEQIVSIEMEIARRLYAPEAKIACFTMRGIDYEIKKKNPLKTIYSYLMLHSTSKIFDAILCHYPAGRNLIIKQRKYQKPVYMQTQIGVDKNVYKPDKILRNEIRQKYGITDQFVFGSIGRIDEIKGVFDIIDALPDKGNWRFLMIGNGKHFGLLKEKIRSKGLEKFVITPGYIPAGNEIAAQLNAMDCFIHVPKTTKYWVDTFPGVVPEAMATALPIIGSDSGAVPYQLGEEGIIISEGNISALQNAMNKMLENPNLAINIGARLYSRVIRTFEIRHLTKCFNIIMREIIEEKFNEKHIDQTSFEFE